MDALSPPPALFPEAGEPPRRIISASRRTDLPGYHAAECAARLRRLRKPVHSVFFWTRYPAALVGPGPLADLLRSGIENPFVHLTVTGLGGTALEPKVPPTATVLALLEPLIAALRGQAERLLWRYDPVLLERMDLRGYAELCQQMGSLGVRRCIISFPALMSLKGSLQPAYARHGLSRPGIEAKVGHALRLAELAARHGIAVQACCQPKVVARCGGALGEAACIDAALAARLHPRGIPLPLGRDPSQRRSCNCALSHDIGDYADLCGSGCAYCYSRAGGSG